MAGAADVAALIQAAGRGERLGRGPKAFVALGGRTLLERAVDVMRAVAGRVIVGAPPDDLDRARRLCGDRAAVLAGGPTRAETLLRLVEAADAPLLLVHDVAHPFATAALSRRVIEAARARGAAAAVVPAAARAYHEPPGGPPVRLPPGEVWLTRKPIAVRRDVLERGLARLGAGITGMGSIIAAAGQVPELVPAPPWNVKLTTHEDWALAGALASWLDAGGAGPEPGADA